jgi:large subunit ribosomal protein L6
VLAVKYSVQFGKDLGMSKIGRKPIDVGAVKIEIQGRDVHYQGTHAKGVHVVPDLLSVAMDGGQLFVTVAQQTSDTFRLWGLHRALLANKILGADKGFEKRVNIVGLGFKAIKKGVGLEFSLGFSHKIEFPLPKGLTVEIDKTGQVLTVWSPDKELLGHVCSKICALRPTEPYKGTGIHCAGDIIRRKAGKAKGS